MRTFCFIVLLLLSFSVSAQSKAQLEKDKARVEKEIANLNKQLSATRKQSKAGKQQLELLEKKIAERNRLINNINSQMNLLNIRITETGDSIVRLRNEVDSLKAEYAKVVRVLYAERGNLDKIVLLLDTKSYNTAFLRTKYFRDYSRYRKRQASYIKEREEELHTAGIALAKEQREKSNLLLQEKRQHDALAAEQKERQQTLKKNKQTEKDLQAKLNKKEKQKRQLQQQIQKIINDEIAKARKQQQSSTNKGGSARGGTGASTSTDPLSADFASNKGKLPWPVYYTKVAREYGKYTHSSGGQNMNNGIDLVCRRGTAVQSVATGTVSRIFTCPNGTKGIIIRHGEYMSVYANMASVTVKEGAKVAAKQNLGTVYSSEEGDGEFSFQLWRGTSSLNPRQWLR